jgi:glycosyltransferase involved in cell wall biosynthesis
LRAVLRHLGNTRSSPARVIVHLEDNEQHLLSHTAGVPFPALTRQNDRSLHPLLKKGLAHPVRHQLLLAAADLITGITPALAEFAPSGVPFAHLYPGLDLTVFRPQLADTLLRSELGIHPEDRIIVYPGGANLTNAAELRTLYTAVALLNQRGHRVKLLRTGPPAPWFTDSLTNAERAHELALGFVSRDLIPRLLGLADMLVQPGHPGPFNDYRLPSKLPEFLASGRPVILPATNIAALMKDGEHALFLRDGSPEDICARCETLLAQPELAARLGEAGRLFAEQHFDINTNARRLNQLYEETLARPVAADWRRAGRRFHDEADLFPLSSGRASGPDILAMASKRRRRGGIPRHIARFFTAL